MDDIDQSTMDNLLRLSMARLIIRRDNADTRLKSAINLRAPAIIIGMCEDRLLCYQKQLLEFITPESEDAI